MTDTKILALGRSKEYHSTIYLYDFSWDCDWYWGGGYLGNNNCHYHLNSYFNKDKSSFDAIKEDFGDSLTLTDSELWRFLDLFKQFYAYKEAAGCFHSGGHMTSRGRTTLEIDPVMERALNDHLQDIIIPLINSLCDSINERREAEAEVA